MMNYEFYECVGIKQIMPQQGRMIQGMVEGRHGCFVRMDGKRQLLIQAIIFC